MNYIIIYYDNTYAFVYCCSLVVPRDFGNCYNIKIILQEIVFAVATKSCYSRRNKKFTGPRSEYLCVFFFFLIVFESLLCEYIREICNIWLREQSRLQFHILSKLIESKTDISFKECTLLSITL